MQVARFIVLFLAGIPLLVLPSSVSFAGSSNIQQVSGHAPISSEAEASCLPPQIDWRNYEWILIVGNGKTACEDILGYLRSRPKDAPPPFCADERLPPNGNWRRPDWKEPNKALREELLRDIPEDMKKVHVQKGWEEMLRIARIDITRDGIPENILAYGSRPEDCRRFTRCAWAEGGSKGFIRLFGSEKHSLLPMDETGTRIDKTHRGYGNDGLIWRAGELVYYKGRPYWLSDVWWNQEIHDQYWRFRNRPDDHYARTFELAPFVYLKHDHSNPVTPTEFSNIDSILPDENATCYFGFFHQDNLKKHQPLKRR